jgi:CelD/BcsL family acetyltransferase involved in cellulose biosynthesis
MQPDYQIVTNEEDFNALKESWNRIAKVSGAHIFQTFIWNRAWWKHFGDYGELQIFVFREKGEVVGIAPLFCDSISLFGIPAYRCLRMIGSFISKTMYGPLLGSKAYSDYLDFLILPGHEMSFYSALASFLTRNNMFDELVLDEVQPESALWEGLMPFFQSSAFRVQVKEASLTPVVENEKGWESFIMKLSSKERNNLRRYYKRFADKKKPLFTIHTIKNDAEWQQGVEEFIEMHQRQWNSRGLPGSFAETSMREFFVDVARQFHKEGLLDLVTITPSESENGLPRLAYDIIIRYHQRVYMLHRALDLDSPLMQKGPGNALLLFHIRQAIDQQKSFEFLRGDEPYKLRLATHAPVNKTVVVTRASRFLYYRILIIGGWQRINRRVVIERLKWSLFVKKESIFRGSKSYLLFTADRLKQKKSEQ